MHSTGPGGVGLDQQQGLGPPEGGTHQIRGGMAGAGAPELSSFGSEEVAALGHTVAEVSRTWGHLGGKGKAVSASRGCGGLGMGPGVWGLGPGAGLCGLQHCPCARNSHASSPLLVPQSACHPCLRCAPPCACASPAHARPLRYSPSRMELHPDISPPPTHTHPLHCAEAEFHQRPQAGQQPAAVRERGQRRVWPGPWWPARHCWQQQRHQQQRPDSQVGAAKR